MSRIFFSELLVVVVALIPRLLHVLPYRFLCLLDVPHTTYSAPSTSTIYPVISGGSEKMVSEGNSQDVFLICLEKSGVVLLRISRESGDFVVSYNKMLVIY